MNKNNMILKEMSIFQIKWIISGSTHRNFSQAEYFMIISR